MTVHHHHPFVLECQVPEARARRHRAWLTGKTPTMASFKGP